MPHIEIGPSPPPNAANTLLLEADLKSEVQLRTHAFNLLARQLQIS